MGQELTVIEKKDIEISISKDILHTEFGTNWEKITSSQLVSEYRRVDDYEKMVIDRVKQDSDYRRGSVIEAMKIVEPDNWANIMKDELGVGRQRCITLSRFFRDKHSFDSLVELKNFSAQEKNSSDTIKVEDLSFPTTANELNTSVGLTKKEKVEVQTKAKKSGLDKDQIAVAVARANLAKKAENYTKKEVDSVWNKIASAGLEMRDDGELYRIDEDDGEEVVVHNTYVMNQIQETFDKLSDEMKQKGLELLGEPTKSAKWKELGWTADDEALYSEAYKIKKNRVEIPQFFVEHYPMWKKVYSEISNIVHPDKGGSGEAQAFINDVNSIMSKLKQDEKYSDIKDKHSKINAEYDKWRMAQTDSIVISMSDVVDSIINDLTGQDDDS